MSPPRHLVLALLLLCLASHALCQISFSPNWGTGKRSPPPPEGLEGTCWAQSDVRLLYGVVRLLQKEAMTLSRCMKNFEGSDAVNN